MRALVLLLTAGCTPAFVEADVSLGRATPAGGLTAVTPCDPTEAACTPADLGGRVFSGGMMLGELGSAGGYALTVLGDSDAVLLDPSQGLGGTQTFTLAETTVLPGRYTDPGDLGAEVPCSRLEFNFDWLEATVAFGEGPTWVVRQVFATTATSDDVDGEMRKGDVLIRAEDASTFSWCSDDGCSSERPTAPHADAALAEPSWPGDGNPDYTPVVIPVEPTATIDGAALRAGGLSFDVALALEGAVRLDGAPEPGDPASITRVARLRWSSDETPIRATVAASL
jgi:hypothetical protein